MLLSDLSNALLRDIRNLIDYADDYNVSIQVGEEPNVEVFRAHSVILRARSPYFRTALSTKWATKKDDLITYKKPNISPGVFKDVLRYIYTGTIDLAKETKGELLELLVAADELALDELVEYIQDHIIQNENEWLRRNIVHIHQTSTRHKSCGKLKSYCEERICEDASLIFQSDDFVSLEDTSLVSLLKRDDLGMEEIQIWDYVIKWALAQNPDASSNISEWSDENIAAMKRTLQGCIPHIRFFQISSTDYYYKVRPYKRLLPHDIKENLKLYYLVPKSEPKSEILPPRRSARLPDSTIITAQHAALISSWIDRREASNESLEFGGIPHEFKLIARGSRDGFSRQSFKTRCDKQGPTVVIIKVVGSGQLIGGYNPKQWNSSGQWIVTKDSFIFSLGVGHDIKEEAILSRVINPEQAIRDCATNFDCVGFGCGDLHIIEGSCTKKDYEREIVDTSRFVVEDYEVFQVFKKNSSLTP